MKSTLSQHNLLGFLSKPVPIPVFTKCLLFIWSSYPLITKYLWQVSMQNFRSLTFIQFALQVYLNHICSIFPRVYLNYICSISPTCIPESYLINLISSIPELYLFNFPYQYTWIIYVQFPLPVYLNYICIILRGASCWCWIWCHRKNKGSYVWKCKVTKFVCSWLSYLRY